MNQMAQGKFYVFCICVARLLLGNDPPSPRSRDRYQSGPDCIFMNIVPTKNPMANCHLSFVLYMTDPRGKRRDLFWSTPHLLTYVVPSSFFLSISMIGGVTSPTVIFQEELEYFSSHIYLTLWYYTVTHWVLIFFISS